LRILLLQEFDEGHAFPMQEITALLNNLKTEEPCAVCGHAKLEHTGGIGKCTMNEGFEYGGRKTCDCKQYITKQMQANQGAVKAAALSDQAADTAKELTAATREKLTQKEVAMDLLAQLVEKREATIARNIEIIKGLRKKLHRR
jgi:hypothetical protein